MNLATIGIGYVTGANDFFHLRPSEAERWDIPEACLQPTVRNRRVLPSERLTNEDVMHWRAHYEPVLLLRLAKDADLTSGLKRYLGTERAKHARQAYKCRVRDPWYAVPDLRGWAATCGGMAAVASLLHALGVGLSSVLQELLSLAYLFSNPPKEEGADR